MENRFSLELEGEGIRLQREFNASVDLVWMALSVKNQLDAWWGPKGFTMKSSTLDFRPGGKYHYGMKGADGKMMWGLFVYKQIEPPRKIVFVDSFSNEKGEITRAPFLEKFPAEIHNTLTLESKENKTLLTIKGRPFNASPEEIKAFLGMVESMKAGFGGMFEKLDVFLEKKPSDSRGKGTERIPK